MVKFEILHCAINSEAGIVPSLFLVFDNFEPRFFYKIVLIKKYCNSVGVPDFIDFLVD